MQNNLKSTFIMALACAWLGSACTTDLAVDPTALITCTEDIDCPEGLRCNLNQMRCVEESATDFDPPVVTSVVVTPPRVGTGGVATVDITFNEPLARPPEVWFERGALPRANLTAAGSTGNTYSSTYAPQSDDVDGEFSLSASFVDPVGNRASGPLNAVLGLDFTLPDVLAGSVGGAFLPAEDNLLVLTGIAPIDADASANFLLFFTVTEPLSASPAVRLVGPSSLDAEEITEVGQFITATWDFSAASEGTYDQVEVDLIDEAGNMQTVTVSLGGMGLPSDTTVDTTPPPAPDVNSLTAIRYERAPTGSNSVGATPTYRLFGGSGAVTPGTRVYVYGQATDLPEAFIGRADSNASGGWDAPILLRGEDRSEVFVRAVDDAGNFSEPAVRVRNVDWLATLGGKQAGSISSNPHSFFAQTRSAGLPLPSRDAEFGEVDGVSAQGGASVRTAASGTWITYEAASEPEWRYDAKIFGDITTNTLYLLGGSGNVGCDGSPTRDCLGLFRRGNLGWTPVPNLTVEGETLPELDDKFQVAYDIHRGVAVGYDADFDRTWEWNGLWRPIPQSAGAVNPPTQFGFALAYDAARRRLTMFGGQNGLTYYNTIWTFDGATWTERMVTGDVPLGRRDPVFVYDPNREVIVMFGGYADVGGTGAPCGDGRTAWTGGRCYYDDIWEWNGGQWTQRCDGVPGTDVCGAPPQRVQRMAAAYDPVAEAIFMFGGYNFPGGTGPACPGGVTKVSGYCVYDQLFTFDGSSWSDITPSAAGPSETAPLPRFGTAMGYDVTRGRMLIKGGAVASFLAPQLARQTTYELRESGWLAEELPGGTTPDVRTDFAMESNGNGSFYLWGGADYDNEDCGGAGTIECEDGYFWGFDVGGSLGWQPNDCASGASCPNYMASMAMAWDQTRNRLIMVGGIQDDGDCDGFGSTYCLPTWEIDADTDGADFTRYTVAFGPADRVEAAASSGFSGVYVFGGRKGSAYRSDLWAYTGSGGWTQLCNSDVSCPGPQARAGHAMTFDESQSEAIMFGGELASGEDCGNGTRFCNDTWIWQGEDLEWQLRSGQDPEGDGDPAPRYEHTLYFDTDRGTAVLYGGRSRTASPGEPCGDGTFSSASSVCVFSDVWEWTGSSWVRVDVVDIDGDGGPGRRSNHGMAYISGRREAVMMSGSYEGNIPNRAWFFRSGGDARPAHVFQFDLTQANLDPTTISDVEVDWLAGAVSDSGTCSAQNGSELAVFKTGEWTALATNNAPDNAPAFLTWSAANDSSWTTNPSNLLNLIARGEAETVAFAVRPQGFTGCFPGRARITTDSVEARVRFRLP